MKIVIYGLSITSSWGNGHATTYRSLVKALAGRGHRVIFVEKDVEWYRSHRDLPDPDFCQVQLYEKWDETAAALLHISADADAIIIGSYFPDAMPLTERLVDRNDGPLFFYDVDTPITLSQLRLHGRADYLDARMIEHYTAYLSFTGGPVLAELEEHFHAQRAIALYCSVDPLMYRPLTACREYTCDLSYLGTYAEDRQAKLMHLLDAPAALLPGHTFCVAGPQYPDSTRWQPNVQRIHHLAPADHAAFYSSSRYTLNLTRKDMVASGYSPSVRIFEAGACGAAIVSDSWPGMATFLEPGSEILIPESSQEVVDILTGISEEQRICIGQRARERILAEHTSEKRAMQFEQIVSNCSHVARLLDSPHLQADTARQECT